MIPDRIGKQNAPENISKHIKIDTSPLVSAKTEKMQLTNAKTRAQVQTGSARSPVYPPSLSNISPVKTIPPTGPIKLQVPASF